MKLQLLKPRTPIIVLRSALARIGLRTKEDYDELVHITPDGHLRLSLCRLGNGQLVRCFISIPEKRLLVGALELFNQLAAEGHPVVAEGMGCGEVSFEFEWLHADDTDWLLSARKVESFVERIQGSLGPIDQLARRGRARQIAHWREGVLAQPANAA